MPPWYKRTLSSEDALGRAKTHLESACNSKDRRRAQKLCDEAKETLERIDMSKSIKDRNQIIAVYQEHGKLLEKLGLADEAKISYNKAERLTSSTADQNAPASALHVDTTPASTPSPSITSNLTPGPSSTATHSTRSVISTIFTNDCPPPVTQCVLPGPDERLVSTRQLALCLALLQASSSSLVSLDSAARTWLSATENNRDELDRLRTLSTDLVRALARDELKDRKTISEVVCLAPILEKVDYRSLLSLLVNAIKDSLLLDIQALEGLAHLIQSASPGYLDADDLVKILELLSTRLQETFQQSPQHIYELTITVSRVLDAMADCNIQGLDRVKLHEPLLSYLGKLKADKDPYIVYQAAYAFQALLCVPDDEEPWQAALRRSGAVIKGVGGLASAIKGLNVAEFINGLSTIQEGLQGASQIFSLAQDAYNGVSALKESGQGLLESLKSGLSFSHKRAWYAALRGADALIQNGEMTKFKTLVCEAPCRRELAFQWGICQRLGYLAGDSVRDDGTREDAIAFLGEMYSSDEEWGQEPRIKQCILEILLHLSQASGHITKGSMNTAAENLLRILATNGDENKKDLYVACIQSGPSPHSWKVDTPLPDSSSLMDQVQNKPSLEPALRIYQRRRLYEQEQRHAIYIPPQAKPTRDSSDDDLFDLTTKVNEFITGDGDAKVLLLLGNSGAGKSTFNLELEKNLWKVYNVDRKWIPIFVTLPAIDKPEEDLVIKQLRKYDFTEDQVRELKSFRQFVLICDGYDECQKKDNLYNDNRLNQHGEWNVKMVISCRSEFLGSDYRIFFQPGGRNDRKGASQLQEAVVAPFTATKINDYIRSYVAKDQSGGEIIWKVEDYGRVISNIPNLRDLVRNPFLLSLALEVLPRLVDLSKDLTSKKISRVTLYDQFVEQWVERGQIRLLERSLTGDDHAAFEILSEDGFTQNAIGFVKDLAVAIFDNQGGKPVVEYSPIRDKSSWKTAFFGQGDGKNLLRETCPLSRTGNQYRFIHRSVLEYGVARAVYEPTSSGADDQGSVEQLEVQQWTNLDELSAGALSGSPLFRKSFVHEPSIINFLSERVQQSTEFKNQLHWIIEQSKADDRFIQAAANAITILVRAGVRFNGADLKGIRIPGANLSGGQFDCAQLQGSDLSNTNLRNVWLRRADLSNSQMEGATFGQHPYLSMDHATMKCAFSPQRGQLAVGLHNGSIMVYETSTWSKLNFQGDPSSVESIGYPASDAAIASANQDNTEQSTDEQTTDEGYTLSGHSGPILCVAYSPDGLQIASGAEDLTIRLWNAVTGELGLTLSGPDDFVNSVAYSPCGRKIISAWGDYIVRVWDTVTGDLISSLSGHTDPVVQAVYSPSGSQIASSSSDGTIRLWNAQTGEVDRVITGLARVSTRAVYSPSGHQIASSSKDKTVRLWDVQTGELLITMTGHTDVLNSVAFSPDGHQIATASGDMSVRLWDAQTGELTSTLSGHTDGVITVAYSPDGQIIASGSWDKTVRLWDAHTDEPDPSLTGHTNAVLAVAFSPSGHQITTGSKDTIVRLWDAQTGDRILALSGHSGYVQSVVYSPSGHQIASGGEDRTVRLWDAQSGDLASTLSGHTDVVKCVVYSPSGKQIASSSHDMTVRLWDSETGELTSTLSGHTDYIMSVVYSPTGHQIASGSYDNTARLWDAETGEPGYVLIHEDFVEGVTYSPKGDQIASACCDCTVQLWDAQTGERCSTLRGHTNSIFCVAYSPNGQLIASGGEDKTVRVWDAGSSQCLLTLDCFQKPVFALAWTSRSDVMYLATGCHYKSLRSWKVYEDEGKFRAVLHWQSSPPTLVVSRATIKGVQGLSKVNTRLLLQREALEHSDTP